MNILGQVLPQIQSLTSRAQTVQLFVASENALKVDAAKNAFLQAVPDVMQLLVKGFNTKSNVEEQPVNGRTYEGAMNRLTHLKMLAKEMEAEDTLSVFVSMENGIFSEQVEDLQNPELFYDTERQAAWVDRCIVIIEVASRGIASAYSQGVTVPVSAVLASLQTGCSKTCGFFIENEYGFASKDWHGQMAGVSRKELMEEAIVSALKKI